MPVVPHNPQESSKGLVQGSCLGVNHLEEKLEKPKTEAALEAIIQRQDETLREFINRFNHEAIQVPCMDHKIGRASCRERV